MAVKNWSCHPAAVIRHAMDANPAIGLGQVEIADISTEFPIVAAGVRCKRTARKLVKAFNLDLNLFDRYCFHRCLFSIFKVKSDLPCTAGRVLV
jgi:hypothetical protein